MTSDDDVTVTSSATCGGVLVSVCGVRGLVGSRGTKRSLAEDACRRSALLSVLVTVANSEVDFRGCAAAAAAGSEAFARCRSSELDEVSRPLLTDRETVSEVGGTPAVAAGVSCLLVVVVVVAVTPLNCSVAAAAAARPSTSVVDRPLNT